MKKLSISLFAILAIVFAVSSAFTTRPKKATNLTGEWYVIKQNTNLSLATFETGGSSAPINDISNYEEVTTGIADVFDQTDMEENYCFQEEPSEFVCAVEFSGADSDLSSDLDATELDAFLSAVTPTAYKVPNSASLSGIRYKDVD